MKALSFPKKTRGATTMQKCFATIICALIPAISFAAPLAANAAQQDIDLPALTEVSCASYLVYDRTKGEILISKEPDTRIYPASMTKIMTALLALEYLETDKILTVSQSAINATTPNSTLMGLKVGEEISVSELLYGLMLPSGNDAANVLAEAIVTVTGPVSTPTTDPATGVEPPSLLTQFADVMNRKAVELGLINTHFMNANGLHDDNHYTTAMELAKMFDAVLAHEEFRAAISSPTHVFKATNIHTFDAWSVAKNTNQLLSDPWILGPDTSVAKIVGGKTGTTIPAGTGMTMLSVNKNGDELISVICGIPYEDASRLTSYMASVLNAGADVCFQNDPVVRVEGNVMDNKPQNVSAAFEEAVANAATPTPTATPSPTASPSPDPNALQPTQEAQNPNGTDPSSKSGFVGLILAHPLISAAVSIFVIVVLLLVITYFVANRKRKSSRNGIRRI